MFLFRRFLSPAMCSEKSCVVVLVQFSTHTLRAFAARQNVIARFIYQKLVIAERSTKLCSPPLSAATPSVGPS